MMTTTRLSAFMARRNAFFRVLKISGKIFSRRYELFRDSQKSILGMVVCKSILLVFSGGDSLSFYLFIYLLFYLFIYLFIIIVLISNFHFVYKCGS